jgi:hypothetical protein
MLVALFFLEIVLGFAFCGHRFPVADLNARQIKIT